MLDSRYHHPRRRHRCRRHHRYHYRHQQAIAKKHQPKTLQEMLQKISGNRCNNKKTPLLQETPGTHCKKAVVKITRAGWKNTTVWKYIVAKKHQSRKKKIAKIEWSSRHPSES